MKKNYILLVFSFLIFNIYCLNAQYNRGSFNHEIGVTAGLYQLRGDYGERNNSENNFANQGVSIGLNYYYNSANRRSPSYFQSHFRIKGNFTFSSVSLEHIGPEADDPRLAAMTGSSTNFRVAGGLEWHIKSISFNKARYDSNFFSIFSPYIGLLFGVNFAMPDAESSLEGGLDNPDNIYPTFISNNSNFGINLENQSMATVNFQLGTRLKISDNQDFIIESDWAFFNSDFVDGLSPFGAQNKNNDWSWGINIGYAYTFR